VPPQDPNVATPVKQVTAAMIARTSTLSLRRRATDAWSRIHQTEPSSVSTRNNDA
jgi:hypothetical protein